MRCRKVQALLSEYLEGDLRARQAELMRQHLAACADCKRELVRLRSALGSLARAGALAPPAPNLADLHRRIAAAEARRLAPRWRWAYAMAPAVSLLVALAVWLTVGSSRLELSSETVAYTSAMPGDVPVFIEPPAPPPSPPVKHTPVAPVRARVLVARMPKASADKRTKGIGTNTPPHPAAVASAASYDVSLSGPGGGTVSVRSRVDALASGEPTKVVIRYEGPAVSTGSGTSSESGTTL